MSLYYGGVWNIVDSVCVMCVGLCTAVRFFMLLGMDQKLDMGVGYEPPRLKSMIISACPNQRSNVIQKSICLTLKKLPFFFFFFFFFFKFLDMRDFVLWTARRRSTCLWYSNGSTNQHRSTQLTCVQRKELWYDCTFVVWSCCVARLPYRLLSNSRSGLVSA